MGGEPPGRMRLTSRQSISPWCATRRVFRHRSEQQATRRSSRRHRRSAVCAAVPHPSTKLPPRETARSDAFTIEMSALEARPPTHTHTHTWVLENTPVWTAYPRSPPSRPRELHGVCEVTVFPCASSLKRTAFRNGGPGAAEPAGRRTPGPLLTSHARAELPMPRRAMHSVWRPPATRFPLPQLHVLRHTSVPRPRRLSQPAKCSSRFMPPIARCAGPQ